MIQNNYGGNSMPYCKQVALRSFQAFFSSKSSEVLCIRSTASTLFLPHSEHAKGHHHRIIWCLAEGAAAKSCSHGRDAAGVMQPLYCLFQPPTTAGISAAANPPAALMLSPLLPTHQQLFVACWGEYAAACPAAAAAAVCVTHHYAYVELSPACLCELIRLLLRFAYRVLETRVQVERNLCNEQQQQQQQHSTPQHRESSSLDVDNSPCRKRMWSEAFATIMAAQFSCDGCAASVTIQSRCDPAMLCITAAIEQIE
jgi:hypothetical protein